MSNNKSTLFIFMNIIILNNIDKTIEVFKIKIF